MVVPLNAINDNNEIAATAVIKEPQKNIKGQDVFDSNGARVYAEHIVAVKLVPISGGSIDNCSELVEEEPRQGASVYWLLMISLVGGLLRFSRGRFLS